MAPVKTFLFLILCITISIEAFKIMNPSVIKTSLIKNQADDCLFPTNFQFGDLNELSKNKWMNQTFNDISRNYRYLDDDKDMDSDNGTHYHVWRVILNFEYQDQNQTAKFGQNDLILVQGGYVKVGMSFDCYSTKVDDPKYQKTLSVTAVAKSQSLLFSLKAVNPTQSYYSATLALNGVVNVTMNQFEISSIRTKDTSQKVTDEDIAAVNYILYKAPAGFLTVKFDLERGINKNLRSNLEQNIITNYDSAMTHYNTKYIWQNVHNPQRSVLIETWKANSFIRLQKTTNPGIYYSYTHKIQNLTNPKCDTSSIKSPLDPKIYGNKQEFLSFTLYHNVILYAIQQNKLDTELNRKNWSTEKFRYHAGQLFPILTDLDKKFYSNAEVNGTCMANPDSLSVGSASDKTFKVKIGYQCELFVEKVKVLKFSTNLQIEVQGIAVDQSIDFQAQHITSETTYDDSYGFKISDKNLADTLVFQGVARLFEENLFGSGWPVFVKRQNPQFKVLSNATLVYDEIKKN